MLGRTRQVVRFNDHVVEHSLMDSLRQTECLCINCAQLNVRSPNDNCVAAQIFYETCLEHNVALAITRCPRFQQKEGSR
jgi:hypothetical protein